MEKEIIELQESEWIWHRLKRENRPIVLYGMGNGAEKILRYCAQFGIKVRDLFASDEFVRGQVFAGFQVKRYDEICALYEDPILLVAFGTERQEVLHRIYQMAKSFEVLAPDIPLFGEELASFDWIGQHEKQIEQVYENLADNFSREVFQNLLDYKLSGKIQYLISCTTLREEALSLLFPLEREAVYIDLGAYDGDTIIEFINSCQGIYNQIVAFEPDKKNYAKLQRKIKEKHIERILLLPYASWSGSTELILDGRGGRNSSIGSKGYPVHGETVDHILQGSKASLIKMDVEGAEYETLLGCQKTLQKFVPKLIVSAYHRTWDIVTLPLYLWNLQPEYQIFLRHHPYIPNWETNLYVIHPSINER